MDSNGVAGPDTSAAQDATFIFFRKRGFRNAEAAGQRLDFFGTGSPRKKELSHQAASFFYRGAFRFDHQSFQGWKGAGGDKSRSKPGFDFDQADAAGAIRAESGMVAKCW